MLPQALAVYEASPYKAMSAQSVQSITRVEDVPKTTPFLDQLTTGKFIVTHNTCGTAYESVMVSADKYKDILIQYEQNKANSITNKKERLQYNAAMKSMIRDLRAEKSMSDEYVIYEVNNPTKAWFAKADPDGEVNFSDKKYGASYVCGGVFRKSNHYREARFGCAPLVEGLRRCAFTVEHIVDAQ